MKRLTALLLAGLLLLAVLPLGAMAAEADSEEYIPEDLPEAQTRPAANRCGEDLTWGFSAGTLTVEGNGPMYDFPEGAPWDAHRSEIRSLVLRGNVTYVGENAFRDYDALTSADLGTALTEAGKASFSSCDGLETVTLPAGFRVFGEESFSHCSNLKEFRFGGSMPSFRLNCLWDTQAKLIYPANNPWPLQHIEQLEGAFQGRIEFLSSDGTDPYTPEDAPEPQTEAAPPETVPAAAEAPATVPPQTEPVPQTQPVTEPEPLPIPQTQPETEPARPTVPVLTEPEFVELQEQPQPSRMSPVVIVLIVVMVISGLAIAGAVAAMILKSRRLDEELEQPQILPGHPPRREKPEDRQGSRTAGTGTPGAPSGTAPQKPAAPDRPTRAQKAAGRKPGAGGGKFSR